MLSEVVSFLESYAAEVIAGCALVLTLHQIVVMRRHNILSVEPHLTTWTHRDENDGNVILCHRLLNNGLGPAFIKSFQIYLDNCPVDDPDDAVASIVPVKIKKKTITKFGEDYAMSAKESADILIIECALEEGETLDQVQRELTRLDLVIEYASAYRKSLCFDSRQHKIEER